MASQSDKKYRLNGSRRMRWSSWICGPPSEFEMEFQILNWVLLTSGCLSILLTIENLVLRIPFPAAESTMAVAAIAFFGYYIIRIKKKFSRFIAPIFYATFLLPATFIWFSSNGLEGAIPYFYIVPVLAAAIVMRGRLKLIVLTITALHLFTLIAIERIAPQTVSPYPSENAHWIDTLIGVIYAITFGLGYISILIHNLNQRVDEAHRAELGMKEKQKELDFRNLLLTTQQEASIDGVLIIDANGQILSCNHRFMTMWEIPRDVIESKSDDRALQLMIERLANPDEFIDMVTYLHQHQTETSRDEILLKNGMVFDRYSAPMMTDDEVYSGRVWYFRDITDQKNSEEKMKRIVNTLPHLISIYDLNLKPIYSSPSVFRLTGYTPEEKNNLRLEDCIPPEYIPQLKQILRDALAREQSPNRDPNLTITLEHEGIRKDGSRCPVESTYTFLRDSSGVPTGILTLSSDITERKNAELALRESERRLADIINFLPIATVVIDHNGLVTAWNREMEDITGIKRDDIIGKGNYEYALPFYGERRPILIDLVSVPQDELTANYSHVRREGEVLTAEAFTPTLGENGRILVGYASALRNSKGDIIGAIESIRDITDIRKTEEELKAAKNAAEAANSSKSLFLAKMSHEIRTPMNAILGFAQLMCRDPSLSQQSQEHLEIINRSGEHLLSLINDILEMSKIEAGRVVFTPSVFDLHRLLENIEMMFRVPIKAKRLSLLVERTADVPRWVNTDEGKLRQVLINLIGNAVKFTDEGGIALRIGILNGDKDTRCLLFEVEDTGPGIDQAEIEKLFQPFEQTSTGKRSGGTGLGLALSRGFISIMGGTMTFDSTLGKGSLFRFTLPFREGKEDEAVPLQNETRRVIRLKPGGEEMRILIADDRDTNRQLLTQMLAAVGFRTREVVNGEDAVAVWRAWKPQVILMDMSMPVMDGYQATQLIKAECDSPVTAIVAVTASAFEEDRQRALVAGADSHLAKPFKEAELFEIIRNLTGVEYLEDDSTVNEASHGTTELVGETIAGMPTDLIERLREAITRADIDLVNSLLDRVDEANPSAAQVMREMAANYRYEELLNLLSMGEPE